MQLLEKYAKYSNLKEVESQILPLIDFGDLTSQMLLSMTKSDNKVLKCSIEYKKKLKEQLKQRKEALDLSKSCNKSMCLASPRNLEGHNESIISTKGCLS